MSMFEVVTEHTYGVHFLGKFSTYQEARAFAEDWIGECAEWVRPWPRPVAKSLKLHAKIVVDLWASYDKLHL